MHLVELVRRHVEDVPQHDVGRRPGIAGVDGGLDGGDHPVRIGQAEARFVQDQCGDMVGTRRAAHRATGAKGVAEQRDRAASDRGDVVDDGGDVVELALERVGLRVAARAEPSPVHRERRHRRPQFADEGIEVVMAEQRPVHEHERRADTVDGDAQRRPVG